MGDKYEAYSETCNPSVSFADSSLYTREPVRRSRDGGIVILFRSLSVNHSAHIRTRLKQPINGAFRLVVAYRRRPYMFLCTENPSLLRSFQVEEICREEKFSHTRQKRSLSFRINEHFNTGCVDFSPPKSCSYVCTMVKQQMPEHPAVSLVPFPVRRRVHHPQTDVFQAAKQ